MGARLGTTQALTSTKELNTWTVAAQPQRTHRQRPTPLGHRSTRVAYAQARRTRRGSPQDADGARTTREEGLSTNPGAGQPLAPPHFSTRSQEGSSEPATNTPLLNCQHQDQPTRTQTADSNSHSLQLHYVTVTSRIHPLSTVPALGWRSP